MRELTCAAGTKNRTLAVLLGMVRHAELKGLRAPESNPCQNLRRHKPSFEATYLEGDDWRRLGKALTALAKEYPSEIGCLKFLALTGCRRGEALGLTWDMIDSSRAALPDAKSGPLAIWLGRPAKRLLASFPKSNVYVFGTDRDPLGSLKVRFSAPVKTVIKPK
jgi:integrase